MTDTDGPISDVPLKKLKQRGMFEFELDIPFVYIGKLKSGERYSLPVFVTEILLTPEIPVGHSSVIKME